VVERVAGRANTGHEIEDGCMVTGVGVVVGKGGDGAEEWRWVSVAECRFSEQNECHMTG
jgi:hypothetical protein